MAPAKDDPSDETAAPDADPGEAVSPASGEAPPDDGPSASDDAAPASDDGPPAPASDPSWPVLVTLFAASGFASLVFEAGAMRSFSQVLGNSVVSSALTIASYMAGLALGARFLGSYADRSQRPLRLYGQLEILVAVSGLAVLVARAVMESSVVDTLVALVADPQGPSVVPSLVVRSAFACAGLLAPTFLMGGTLPVLVKEALRRRGGMAQSLSGLYAANALGAAAGVLVAGFSILPRVGIRATLLIGLGMYAFIGVLALAADRALPPPAAEAERDAASPDPAAARADPGEAEAGQPAAPSDTGPTYTVAQAGAYLGITGFTLLALEHVWLRYFSMILGSSTYSFSVVLACVILGIGVGSLRASRSTMTRDEIAATVPKVLCLWVLCVVLPLPLYDDLSLAFLQLWQVLAYSWETATLAKALVAFVLVVLPSACSGWLYPMVTALAADQAGEEGSRVGRVAAVNTAGTVLGISLSTFYLVPWFGLRVTAEGLSALLLVVALDAWRRLEHRSVGLVAGMTAILLAYGVAREPWSWRRIAHSSYRSIRPGRGRDAAGHWQAMAGFDFEYLLAKDGTLASITVERYASGVITLRINGKADASTGDDMVTQRMLAHVPMLIHPDPKEVLVIGLGSGVSGASALAHGIERLDQVEIEPVVAEAARFFGEANRNMLDDPRTHLYLEDAATFLRRSRRQYDVVISEPTNPWIAGVATLFTEEFFARIRERMSDDGVYLQWMHRYEIDWTTLSVIFKAFTTVFPDATLWSIGTADLALVTGKDRPAPLDLARAAARRKLDLVDQDLTEAKVIDLRELLGLQLTHPGYLRDLVAEVPYRNTDDHPVLADLAAVAFIEGGTVQLPEMTPEAPYAQLDRSQLPHDVRARVAAYHGRIMASAFGARELRAILAERPDDATSRGYLGEYLLKQNQLAAGRAHLLQAAAEDDRSLELLAETFVLTPKFELDEGFARQAHALVDLTDARPPEWIPPDKVATSVGQVAARLGRLASVVNLDRRIMNAPDLDRRRRLAAAARLAALYGDAERGLQSLQALRQGGYDARADQLEADLAPAYQVAGEAARWFHTEATGHHHHGGHHPGDGHDHGASPATGAVPTQP